MSVDTERPLATVREQANEQLAGSLMGPERDYEPSGECAETLGCLHASMQPSTLAGRTIRWKEVGSYARQLMQFEANRCHNGVGRGFSNVYRHKPCHIVFHECRQ